MQQSNKKILIISIIILLFLCSVVCFTLVLQGVIEKNTDLIEYRKEVQDIKKRLRHAMAKKLKSVPTSKIKEIKKFVLPIDDSIDLLSKIERIPDSDSVVVSVSSANPKQYFKEIYKLDIAINISGDINSIIDIIKKLENLKYISFIDNIKLTHKEQEDWDAFLTLHMFVMTNSKSRNNKK